MLFRHLVTAAMLGCLMSAPAFAGDQAVTLYAAGSLKTALGEITKNFSKTYGTEVQANFGPSGLMRERIESGESALVFASANMRHPRTLEGAGRGGPVALFTRNKLCALAQRDFEVSSENLLDTLLSKDVRVGTSTPKADPSGDYAWELFDKAGAQVTGAAERLKSKAIQLTGGPESQPAPEGRNTYGWVMENNKADMFLTYCTNAVLAKKEVPGLQIVQVPPSLSVGADYGLMVLNEAPPDAWKLALYILSPAAQSVLSDHGFESSTLPIGD